MGRRHVSAQHRFDRIALSTRIGTREHEGRISNAAFVSSGAYFHAYRMPTHTPRGAPRPRNCSLTGFAPSNV